MSKKDKGTPEAAEGGDVPVDVATEVASALDLPVVPTADGPATVSRHPDSEIDDAEGLLDDCLEEDAEEDGDGSLKM